jgi:hypothetical protein
MILVEGITRKHCQKRPTGGKLPPEPGAIWRIPVCTPAHSACRAHSATLLPQLFRLLLGKGISMVYVYPKCTNIIVADYSKPYRDEVVRYLDLIATTDVGLTLYKFMGRAKKNVRIDWTLGMHWGETGASPINKADIDRIVESALKISRDRHISIGDAVTAAQNEDAVWQTKARNQYEKDHPVMQEITIGIFDALGLHSNFMFPTADKGTGLGVDVELSYHPAAFRQIMKNTGRVPVGFGPGEALYHELVHALRMMLGLLLVENVPERWNMDSFEEFCSILAANMYRSARGFETLRYDHRFQNEKAPWRGTTELPAALTDSKKYYEHFKPQIIKWFNNQRDFCTDLATSCAPFNPMKLAAKDLGIPVTGC